MVVEAITALNDPPKTGSSRQAIQKYIIENYNLDDVKRANSLIKKALLDGCQEKKLRLTKGNGACGSFSLFVKNSTTSKLSKHSYTEMASAAIVALMSEKLPSRYYGSSARAILKYVLENYKIDASEKAVKVKLNRALLRCCDNGLLQRVSGEGLAGKFTIGEKNEPFIEKINKLMKKTSTRLNNSSKDEKSSTRRGGGRTGRSSCC